MAAIFQIRRGSGSVSLVDGELYVNKGIDSLQYAVGEREITLAKLDEPNTGSLNLNGNITASNAYFRNDVKIDGKITVGNETGDTLNIVASLSSSLIPSGSKLFDLGSQTNYYKSLYVETISASFISGAIAGIGSLEVFSQSVDNRLDRLEESSSLFDNRTDNLETTASNHESRIDLLEISSGSLNSFTQSANGRLNNLESKSASVDVLISNLHSYTHSLNNAIQLTGSTVSFLGNIVVYGTQSVINSTNLQIGDNLIYLATASVVNIDFGIIGHYNDGVNRHGGVFRSATDGAWRVFKNYQPEISGTINLTETTFAHADFYANEISASSLVGIGNITAYSTSVNSRLSNLESTSASVNTSISALNSSSASQQLSIDSLNTFSGSTLGRLTNLESKSASVDTSVASLNSYTSSNTTILNTFTASANERFTEIGVVSGSLILSASAVSSSVWNLNQFTSSTSQSLWLLNSASANHEGRIDYIEGIAFGGIDLNAQFAALQIVTSSLNISTSSLNTFSSSTLTRLTNLESTSASVNTSIANLNSFSSSALTRLTALEVETANLETFTSSINTTIKSKLDADGVISGSAQLTTDFDTRYLNTGGDNAFSSSAQIGNYVATITGTTNQVIVAGSGLNNASVTLSTPQNIATTSDVQFNNITASAGIRAAGDVIAFFSSDERLKENIHPIENALSKVELISGNTYDWKEGFDNIHPHKGNDVGVIAQEVEKVLPQVVINRENGYKAVDYEKIVPLLIEAIKELSAKVKELENK